MKILHYRVVFGFLIVFVLTVCLQAQTKPSGIPSPKSILGFEPTTDKTIADWRQITDYFAKLDAASERIKVETIGQTTLGKPFIVAFISSEENIRNLDKYKAIQAKLADPRTVKDDKERDRLVADGKTVVVISCSIHSTEIVASQMSLNLAFQMATANDADSQEILNNTILLLIPSANPDGVQIVADWYKKTLGTFYEGTSPPELYHHYAGHDNNRDWFMLNLAETRLVTNLFWRNWYPQIVYDLHQMGETGARFIIPPFFDPPNPNISPLILRETGLIGYKIAADLEASNFKGVATNAYFDTWWHGGFRSTPYYHNSIGILSEAASANLMSPVRITDEQLRKSPKQRGLMSPLETATNHPAAWTGGIWSPRDIADLETTACRSVLTMAAKFRMNYLKNFYELNRFAAQFGARPEQPLAYVIQAGQPNAENVSRLIEILIAQGVEIYRMNRELKTSIAGSGEVHTEIPLNSFLVFTAQPQRANVQALFERQVYPNRLDSRGEAEIPYDVAGWTLPLQMGVDVQAVTQIVEYPHSARQLEKITDINQARKAMNLNPAGAPFAKLPNPLLKPIKIGLYKSYTATADEGWTRYLFDSFQIPFQSILDADIKKGDLKTNFDAIILPAQSDKAIVEGLKKGVYPDEFVGGLTEAGVENLRQFVESGGTLICFDDSCEMVIKRFNLPLTNVLDKLKSSEFYCPGSILSLDVDPNSDLSKGFKKQTPAYFINSSAFEITDQTKAARVKIAARYAEKNALLSGWLRGEKYLNGKIALAEVSEGKGKIILFGFRPQHRGQTWGTFPFIFNSLTN
ncbi:MAG: M14 metallopeptidase family protein [Pyrinomonadaceae bacterium]